MRHSPEPHCDYRVYLCMYIGFFTPTAMPFFAAGPCGKRHYAFLAGAIISAAGFVFVLFIMRRYMRLWAAFGVAVAAYARYRLS
ncbi:uncharacterized protein BKA55DRAFT_560784 [Fusarium redolens]|jgi:hypothetical protein|uniref:Uncharacterized protein n=1 Tax=Fusarium redolens TaxID=48865 RepID=A0A9P9HPS5_FUSRE|nr:uncharacterized protein BKA55DRAFT_560784 [Fusarium redolens]KAH7261241.1 hypothetical protein BKA55DRAFT_560784 [Fusarium redolens]